MAFFVGDERRVRFWLDKWCGDEPLSSSFSSIFVLSHFQKGLGH